MYEPTTTEVNNEIEELESIAIFGFDGKIASGLRVHPDSIHMVYPLGNKISIINTKTNKQKFLCGHTNTIANLDISKSGSLIASGQINHMGFRAYVIIWDWESKKEKCRHELHKVRVEALCFTSNELYLITLGGRDDGMIIVWDIINNSAVCGAQATTEVTGSANALKCLHRRGAIFLSGGEQNLRLWCINLDTKKLMVQDVIVGKIRRDYTGMVVNARDEIMYAGTMSGDIVKIRLNCHHDPEVIEREKNPVLLGCFGRHNAKRAPGKDCEKYVNGVRALLILPNGNLIIGAGDGTVEMVEERNVKFKDYPSPTWPQLKMLKRTRVNGPISSLELFGNDILIGTEACEIYNLKLTTFAIKLLVTCNTSSVYDIAFPHKFSLVFATASYQSVRIWSTTKMQELLRIIVPNFSAAAIVFSHDGKQIVSAWNDGAIRSFTPLTGKLIYAIPNAHNKGCSALTISGCGKLLVSGGCEGQVRIWKIQSTRQSLIGVLKEHTAPIATVDFNCFNTEVVSSSSDGTCIIWDIARLSRKHVLYANTQFTCARYYPSGVQILATGSDRRISYWEVYDASLVRDVEGSGKGSINCVSMNYTGEMFISVGNDQIVRLWDYQTALPTCVGYGHAAVIVTCRFSPCGKFLVTGSADGAIFIWRVPEKYWPHENIDPLNVDAMSLKESVISTPPSSSSSSTTKSKQSVSTSIINKNVRQNKSIEHITELETSRSNKDPFICECPPVDLKCQPDFNENCVYKGCEIGGGDS